MICANRYLRCASVHSLLEAGEGVEWMLHRAGLHGNWPSLKRLGGPVYWLGYCTPAVSITKRALDGAASCDEDSGRLVSRRAWDNSGALRFKKKRRGG